MASTATSSLTVPAGSARAAHRLAGVRGVWWRRFWLLREWAMVGLIKLCGISSILFVTAIFLFILCEGLPFLRMGHGIHEFFATSDWYPTSQNPTFGILSLMVGTGAVTILAMLFAVPFGLATAVLISEFCSRRVRETLKIVVELLAAVPSVVWGFIGLKMLGPVIVRFTGADTGVNALNAGLIVGLMSVPIVVSIGEDALRAVPDTFREAAEALGATRWQMVRKVLFPAARSGLLAAALLGVGRAIGETMAVLMCTGQSIAMPIDGAFPYLHPLSSVGTMTATIASELGEVEAGGLHYRALFLLGSVLFLMTFIVNLTADLIVRGIRGKK
ncbi:MAG: phosphate ABC transporter permease subunit PstC [Phycisphaerae bacterium]|nr:phosphate ABC transporter permease subunit PstC [Phycisphaerae bacterium]